MPETLGLAGIRQLKNRLVVPPEIPPPLNHPVKEAPVTRRDHPHVVKLAIGSHHTQQTLHGFSRKSDGTLYCP